MVLGETVHSFQIAVQIQQILLCGNWVGTRIACIRGGEVECRMTDTSLKEFFFDANANQKLCIAVRVNGQNASHPDRMEKD
jgi:hypothetical protein